MTGAVRRDASSRPLAALFLALRQALRAGGGRWLPLRRRAPLTAVPAAPPPAHRTTGAPPAPAADAARSMGGTDGIGGAGGIAGAAARAAACSPAMAALAALLLVQAWALWRSPAAWFPETITIRLAAGQALTLGAADLAAPRADAAHIALSRDAGGGWHLRNLAATRPASVHRGGSDGGELRLAGAPLAEARSFRTGGALFAVTQATPAAIEFLHGGHAWRYDGATLYRDGGALAPCADASAAARGAALWNRIAPGFATLATPLAIGGNVHCGNRLGVSTLPPGAATVARGGGQLRLAAAPSDDGNAALLVHTTSGVRDARRLDTPLSGVTSLSVAGARYAVSGLSGDVLTLAPSRRVALYSEARLPASASPAVSWHWRQRTPWWQSGTWQHRVATAALAVALAAMLAAARKRLPKPAPGAPDRGSLQPGPAAPQAAQQPARTRGPWLVQFTCAAAVLAAGVAALAAQRGGTPPAALFSLLLAAAGAALWRIPCASIPAAVDATLWRMPRAGFPPAVGAALVLAMAGLLMQLELGLAAPDLAALRHYHKTAALLAIGSAMAACWRLWRQAGAVGKRARPVHQRGAEWTLAALTATALAALGAQALWGDETGVFDMQPVELAKLALAALSAHGLALHLGGRRDPGWRWLRLAAPALLFCALLGMALVSVDDYSPLILLAVWAGCVALAYAAAARRAVLAASLAVMALALVAMVWTLRSGGPDVLARLPQGFYADRFQVWLSPQAHPHTGQQWLQGAGAIAAGGWSGADRLFGLRSAGMPDSAAAAIPAVQDDFAPSFFMYRHGLLGALLLWSVQAALLAGLLQQAVACHRRAGTAQGFRPAWRERLRCFLLCGGAAFLFGHFLLSWGTNLAIFPVMGQPMSFMSAGGSHLLFFLCPLLAVSMDAVQPS